MNWVGKQHFSAGGGAKGKGILIERPPLRSAAAAGEECATTKLETTLAYWLSARRVASSTTPRTTSALTSRSESFFLRLKWHLLSMLVQSNIDKWICDKRVIR